MYFFLCAFFGVIFYAGDAFALDVSGVVRDAVDNTALIGANVVVKEKPTQGVATGLDGGFVLRGLDDGAVLRITYIGYEDVEVVAQRNMDIKLKVRPEVLDEVVVVGCGKKVLQELYARDAQFHPGVDKCVPTKCVDNYVLVGENNIEYVFSSECLENIKSDTCQNPNLNVKCVARAGHETGTGDIARQVNLVNDAYRQVASIHDKFRTDVSVWKNKDGKFNTSRLVSDSVAGVVLGTAGGLITSSIVKKNQVENGFEDIKCVIGGQTVADWGDEFSVGVQ